MRRQMCRLELVQPHQWVQLLYRITCVLGCLTSSLLGYCTSSLLGYFTSSLLGYFPAVTV